MVFIVLYLLLLILKSGYCALMPNLNHCKLSHNGIEYAGTFVRTESGAICQAWNKEFPQKTNPIIQDEDFVDGSKKEAKNFCRNPKGLFRGPWCYTEQIDLSDEVCAVPLCTSECRLTLVGAEYNGSVGTTITNRKCVHWSEKIYRKWQNKTGIKTSTRILLDDKFPDGKRKKAHEHCRNPTGDVNGPWCFVETRMDHHQKLYQKEYCDIELCNNNTICSFATSTFSDLSIHTHFIKFPPETQEFKPSILLWNLGDFKNATIRMAFSALPLPLSGKILREMNAGIELIISPFKVNFTAKDTEDPWQKRKFNPKLLSGIFNKSFEIEWEPQLYFISMKEPFVSTEYVDKLLNDTLIHFTKGHLDYYSVKGGPALWTLPCTEKQVCEEHVTLTPNCTLYKKLEKRTNSGAMPPEYTASFNVRSSRSVIIELRNSPASMYPFFQINIFGAFNKTTIHLDTGNESFSEYLGSATYDNILSLKHWTKLSISIVGDTLVLVWMRKLLGSETILNVSHPSLRSTIWYTICSQAVAHWVFNCESTELPSLLPETEPECVKSKTAVDYNGNQSVTDDGQPCLPWSFTPVHKETKNSVFLKSSRLETLNYCRNLERIKEGTYCYIANPNKFPDLEIKRKFCNIPRCQKLECKYSGTGIEYTGNVNFGRSHRHCELSNSTGVPRYCTNLDNNIFGPWCNLTKEYVGINSDLCLIPDCYVNDACTMVTKVKRKQARMFVLHPEWITDKFVFKAKTWDPRSDSGIRITMKLSANDLFQYHYILDIGAQNFTTIELRFNISHSNETLLKTKVVPNIIPRGYWQGFWFRVPPNPIEFGYEGSENAIFSWTQINSYFANISANFLSITSLYGQSVGLNFPCSYCLIEKNVSPEQDTFYPFNLWSQNNTAEPGLVLYLRAERYNTTKTHQEGSTIIYLYEEKKEAGVIIKVNTTHVVLMDLKTRTILGSTETPYPLFISTQWTEFEIKYSKRMLRLSTLEIERLLTWNVEEDRKILRFYYFSIVSDGLVTTWLANCHPPNLDDPTDGGWGEWSDFTCTVSCGGGFGYRKRKCNKPKPTYFGATCIGPSSEDGECNKFECGCLNPAIIGRAEILINSVANNIQAKEYDSVTIPCERTILQQAQNDSPGSHVQWLKDGFKLEDTRFQLEDLELWKADLRLENVEEHHSGLYTCVIFPSCLSKETNFITIKLVALTVIPKKPRRVRKTRPLQMICNTDVLQNHFTNLLEDWYVEGFLNMSYVLTNQTEGASGILVYADESCHGTWECIITQTTTNLTWSIKKFKVDVMDEPSFFTYLTEEDAPKILFVGWPYGLVRVFLYFIIVLEMILIIYVVLWFRSARNELLGK